MPSPQTARCLERTPSALDRLLAARRVAIIVAHPDDEVIGAGALLPRLTDAIIIHVTDGASENMAEAHAHGFTGRDDYARARARESQRALALAGIRGERIRRIGVPDQRASWNMTQVARHLVDDLSRFRPDVVLTHPYEGGHPDHDSTAFVAHAACALIRNDCGTAPHLVEMTSYHSKAGQMAVGAFLQGSEGAATMHLNSAARALKLRMMACHATQAKTLAWFPLVPELYRSAPRYPFLAPPHKGKLFYEMFDWGMTGAHWRILSRKALDSLGLPSVL